MTDRELTEAEQHYTVGRHQGLMEARLLAAEVLLEKWPEAQRALDKELADLAECS